jgi:hypothetical protein
MAIVTNSVYDCKGVICLAAQSENQNARSLRHLVLGVSVFFMASREYVLPSVGLDPSWRTALLLGRESSLRWGTDLDFTYGPWGWMHSQVVTSRTLMAASIVFLLGVSIFFVTVVWKLLCRTFSERTSLLLMGFVIVPVFSQVAVNEVFLASIFGMFLLFVDRAAKDVIESWKSILVLTFPIAFILQFKISLGIFAFAGLVFTSLVWFRTPKIIGLVFGTFLSWFFVLWILSEHSLSGFFSWLRLSLSIAGGFSDAMSLSQHQPLTLVLFGAFSVASVALLVRRLQTTDWLITVKIASSLLVLLTLYSALKTGFVREEPSRLFDATGLCFPMWLWLLSPVELTVRKLALLMIPLVAGVGIHIGERPSDGSFGGLYDWPASTNRWLDNLNLLTSNVTFDRKAEEARRAAQQAYALSPKMLEALGDSSIQVDPLETTLVWAYELPWKPVPIFQTHQVYANDVDEFTTEALSRRGAGDAVLIHSDYAENIDGRLSLWTPPRYQLSLTCSWSMEYRDGSWEKWVKAEDKCGSPELITSKSVVSNERVPIPLGSADSLVVAKFESSSSNDLISRAVNLLFKPLHELKVQLGDRLIREPRAFRGAPLIVSCPPDSSVTNRYAAVCPSPESIAFSEPGKVTFERIPITLR